VIRKSGAGPDQGYSPIACLFPIFQGFFSIIIVEAFKYNNLHAKSTIFGPVLNYFWVMKDITFLSLISGFPCFSQKTFFQMFGVLTPTISVRF